MAKKCIIVLSVFISVLFSGCSSNNDFIGRTAEQNNRWLSLYSEKIGSDRAIKEYKEHEEYKDLQKVIKDSVSGTEFENYIIDDIFCIVDLGAYAGSKLESLGYNMASLSLSETSGIQEMLKADGYECVKIEDIVCIKDKSGGIVNNRNLFRVILSEHEDVMDSLDGYGIGGFIRNADKSLLDNMHESIDVSDYTAVLEGYGGFLRYGSELTFLKNEVSNMVNSDTEYLIKEYAGDAWSVAYTASNDVCDCVLYTSGEAVNGILKNDMRLYIYGRDCIIEEINYVSGTEGIPDYVKDTIINYLVKLGMDKDNAEFFVSNPPKDDGNVGNVKYFAGKKGSKYFMKVSR